MANRTAVVELPENVRRVMARGKPYYYHQIGRGGATPGPVTRIPFDTHQPEFWTECQRLNGGTTKKAEGGWPAGSVGAMAMGYAGAENDPDGGSPEWKRLSAGTHENYRIYLNRIVAAWGREPARSVRPVHVLAARDTMKDSPYAANSFLAVGTTLFKWGVPREYCETNPFREIERLETEGGYIPWPRWAWEYCFKHAPEDLARFVFVALHSGQREIDVIRIGPPDREGSGIWIRPKKTGKKRGRFWVPLTATALIEFERMEREPVTFLNKRHGKVTEVKTVSSYVFSPTGSPYTTAGLRSRWNRWTGKDAAGKKFVEMWIDHCEHLAERNDEEFDAEEAKQPPLHGLRGSAVVLRRYAGANHQQIANDIGMSIQMVMHYSRFMDQKEAAESNIVLLEEAEKRLKPK